MTIGNFKAKQEEFVSCSKSESSNTMIDCENIIYTLKKSSKWIIRMLLNQKKKKKNNKNTIKKLKKKNPKEK